jgi:hypothetical protein
MNIEERVIKAEEFLNGLKELVFSDGIFSTVYTDVGTLKDEIGDLIVDLKTRSKAYQMAKVRAKRYSINPFYQGQYEAATRDLESILLEYEVLCLNRILPLLKEKLVDLPNKLTEGKIQLDQVSPIEQTTKEPPLELKATSEFMIPIDSSSDKRINAFKEKINRALEWIEIPIEMGKKFEIFVSNHGATIIYSVHSVLKMLNMS